MAKYLIPSDTTLKAIRLGDTRKGINDGEKVFAGLIAEEVDAQNLNEFVMYDSEGRPDALAYQNMIALLINAVKDLNAKVEALEDQLA